MPAATNRKSKKANNLANLLIRSGLILFAVGVGLLFLVYSPILREEMSYRVRQARSLTIGPLGGSRKELTPVDTNFGIIIPKLGANARVIANVDPFNSVEYQRALTQGVAHAKGTSYPGQNGNIFLFSHSSVDFYRATQFNSVFYLINKLEAGDTIDLYFKGERYTYEVTKKIRVKASAVNYLSPPTLGQTLTLMTCWPPGTTLERLLVIARRKVDE